MSQISNIIETDQKGEVTKVTKVTKENFLLKEAKYCKSYNQIPIRQEGNYIRLNLTGTSKGYGWNERVYKKDKNVAESRCTYFIFYPDDESSKLLKEVEDICDVYINNLSRSAKKELCLNCIEKISDSHLKYYDAKCPTEMFIEKHTSPEPLCDYNTGDFKRTHVSQSEYPKEFKCKLYYIIDCISFGRKKNKLKILLGKVEWSKADGNEKDSLREQDMLDLFTS